MADEPLIAWNNYVDGAVVVAEDGALESAGLPVQNLTNWDNLSPAAFIPGGVSMSIVVGFDQPVDAADTLILGAARHDTAGNRTSVLTLSLTGYAGSGTTSLLINLALTADVNKASLHKFPQTTVAPDAAFYAATVPAISATRCRWLSGRFFTCGLDAVGPVIIRHDAMGASPVLMNIVDPGSYVADIAWDGGNILCAVSSTGNSIVSNDGGLTWSVHAVGIGALYSIAYGNGVFVAASSSSSLSIATSADGITWATQTMAAAMTLDIISYGNGQFVVVGGAGAIQTSPDGVTWTVQTSGTTNTITDVVFGGEWIAVTSAGEMLTSQDAITWSVTPNIGGATSCTHITYADGEYKVGAVVAGVNSVIRSSDGGAIWTSEAVTAGVAATSIASNAIADLIGDGSALSTAASVKVIKSAYRLVFIGTTAGTPWVLPELYLGKRLEMPFVDFGYDPYVEVFKGNTFNAESGRQFTTLHYRRVELKPRWRVVPTAKAVDVDAFRENHLELRKPFWFAWKPDTAPTECYMCRHKGESAHMPISSAVHRGFSLDLIEVL